MGYGRYIGRIGALAVALGIGAAVGTGSGLPTAFADDGTTTTNTTTGGSGTTGDGPTTTDTTTSPTVDAETPTTAAPSPAEGSPPTPGGADGSGPVVVVGDGRNGTTPSSPTQTPPPSTPETPPPSPETTTAPPPPLTSPDPDDHGVTSVPSNAQHQKTLAPATGTASVSNTPSSGPALQSAADLQVASALAHDVSPLQARVAASPSDTPAPSAQQILPTALAAPVQAPAPPPQMNIISAVLSAFGFTPLLAPGPQAPAATPGIWTLLAWVRREVEQTFFNHTPTLKPTQNSLIVDENGEITGSLGASDPDEGETEGLTFRLVQDAAHGHVVIHDDGTWTYTANDGYSGPDSFKVITSDADTGWHVHGLLQTLFSPNGGATQAATVNLVALQAPNVAGSLLQLSGDPVGRPVFSPDGKTGWQLTRPVGSSEGYGVVQFDMATGQAISGFSTSGDVIISDGLVLSADGTRAYFVTKRGNDATDVNVVALDDPSHPHSVVSLVGALMDPDDVVLSADGKRVYVTTREDGGGYYRTHVSIVDLGGQSLVADRSAIGNASGPLVETPSGRIVQLVVADPGSTPSSSTTTYVIILDSHTGEPVGSPLHFSEVTPRGELALDATGGRAMLRLDPVDPAIDSNTLVFVDLIDGTAAHPVYIQSDATARFVGDGTTAQVVTLVAATPTHDASYWVTVLDTATGGDVGSTSLNYDSSFEPVATYADDGTGYYVAPRSGHTDVYAISSDGTSRVFTVDGTFIRGAIFQPTRSAVALNADQSRLYVTTVAGPDGTTTLVNAIDLATGITTSVDLDGSLNSPMVTNEQHTRAIVFTHTPGVTDKTGAYATVIDLATGQPVGSPMKLADDGVDGFPDATFTADGTKAYVVVPMRSIPPGQGTTALTAIDLVTGQALGSVTANGEPADFTDGPLPGLVLGADGTKGFLVTERELGNGDHELLVTGLDLTRPSVAANPIVLAGPGQGPTFTVNDAGTLAVYGRKGANTLFDLNGHSVTVSARDSSGIVDTTFSADGNAAYMRASDHHVGEESTGITTVIRTPAGGLTTLQLELPDYWASDLSLSPDGARAILATRASNDRFLHFIDLGGAATLPDVEVPESDVPINPAQALREWIERTFFSW